MSKLCPSSQSYGFSSSHILVWQLEYKENEHRRIGASELWFWKRLLRVPWTARRSNQSILKEISPGCSLEGVMLKLKLSTLATSCEELTHWKRLWCWEGLGAGGEGDDRGWDGWMASLTQWTWVWVNSGSWWWIGRPGVLRFMGSQRVGHDWATELNWTEHLMVNPWIFLCNIQSMVTWFLCWNVLECVCVCVCTHILHHYSLESSEVYFLSVSKIQ